MRSPTPARTHAPPRRVGEPDGRLLLRIDQANIPLAVVRHPRRHSVRALRLQRQSGDQSLVATALPGLRRPRPPGPPPATTWTTILTIPSATHRTTPGAAAAANPCRRYPKGISPAALSAAGHGARAGRPGRGPGPPGASMRARVRFPRSVRPILRKRQAANLFSRGPIKHL